jgi:hypothetical protein
LPPPPQTDHHIGALTVEETLDFAFTCQNGMAAHKTGDIPEQILQAKVGRGARDGRGQPPCMPA